MTLHLGKTKSLKEVTDTWRADGERMVLLSHQLTTFMKVKLLNYSWKDLLWIGRMHELLTHILATEPLKRHWKKEKKKPQ